MIDKLKKINMNRICIIFILIQPIIDMITSILVRNVSSVFTIGIFIRAIFMVFVVLYSLIISNSNDRKKIFIYYVLFGLYSIIFLISMYNMNGTSMIFTQIKGVVKSFYLPVVLVAMIFIFKEQKIKIETNIYIYTLLIYCIIIFGAKILGIAYPTYSIGLNIGTNGLFYAANEIGIIISILATFLFFNTFTQKISSKKLVIIYILSIFFYIYSILEMGTKVPILAFIGIISVVAISCIINLFRVDKKLYFKKLLGIVGVIILTIACLPYTSAGKNIERNYGETISNLFRKEQKCNENVICKEENVIKEEEKVDNKQEVATAIVSGRNLFFNNNKEKYANSSVINKLFGIGYIDKENNINIERKIVEIDYCDIFFMHGIFGNIIFWFPIIIIIFNIIKITIKNFKKSIIDSNIISEYTIVGLALCVAMLAGHTLVAPAVSIYIVLAIIQLYLYIKQKYNKNIERKETIR